jgi:Carboxypeptidase regulatory-like domain
MRTFVITGLLALLPAAALVGAVPDSAKPLVGTVVAAGAPVREFFVNLTSGGDRISASVGPDDKGRFRIAELPAGTWTVTLRGPDGLRALHESQVTLKAGRTSELTVDVEKEEPCICSIIA